LEKVVCDGLCSCDCVQQELQMCYVYKMNISLISDLASTSIRVNDFETNCLETMTIAAWNYTNYVMRIAWKQ